MLLMLPNTLQDNFEDAHDTAPDTSSIRSLTRRPSINPKPQSTENETTQKDESEDHKEPVSVEAEAEPKQESQPEAEAEAEAEAGPEPDSKDEFDDVDATTLGDENEAPITQQRKSSVAPTQRLSLTSNGQLDTVSLDDETPTKPKGSWSRQLLPRGDIR